MKIITFLGLYIFVLLQCCFAGLLAALLFSLFQYQQVDAWVYALTAGILVAGVVVMFFIPRKVQLYLCRHVDFRWLSFYAPLLNGLVLLMLLVPVVLGEAEGTWLLQLVVLLALILVLFENFYLEQDLLQKVYADLHRTKQPAKITTPVLALTASAIFTLISIKYFQTAAGKEISILEASLLPGATLFIALLIAKVAFYIRLTWLMRNTGTDIILPKKEQRHLHQLQAPVLFMEKTLESLLLAASTEERLFYYSKIRQAPLLDQLSQLQNIYSGYLQKDKELEGTIIFLKRLEEKLRAERRNDIDTLTDVLEIKGYLRKAIIEDDFQLVQKLLHDNRPEIRKAAILASVYFKETALIPVLVNLLKDPEFAFTAKEALAQLGDRSIPFLRSAIFRNKDNSFFKTQSLQLAERYTTKEAGDFLLEILNDPYKRFRYKAAVALIKSNYAFSDLQKKQITSSIESLIGLIATQREIYLAIAGVDDLLATALLEEEKENITLVVALLQAFVPAAVYHYFANHSTAKAGEDTYTLYALIDLHIPLILRNKCKILFGCSHSKNIAAELQPEYLNEQVYFNYPTAAEAVGQILKLDYGQIGIWLRVCALRYFGKQESKFISLQSLAEVFNENPLLQETACELLYNLNYDYYVLYLKRLAPERAKTLRYKIEASKTQEQAQENTEHYLLYQQILFLKSAPFFQNSSYEKIARHIVLFSHLTFQEGKHEISLDAYKPTAYWVIFQGEFSLYYKGRLLAEAVKGDVIDMSFLIEAEKGTLAITTNNLLQVYIIENSALNDLYLSSGSLQDSVIQPYITRAVRRLNV